MKIIIQGGKVLAQSKEEGITGNCHKLIKEITHGLGGKINNISELEENVEEVYIEKMELSFKFKVKGSDELQALTVAHHDEAELFTVIVDVDDDGKIVGQTDNEDESLFSQEALTLIDGSLNDFKEIESILPIDDVTLVDTFAIKDMGIAFFQDNQDEKIVWKQIQDKSKLIQEVKLKLTEEQSTEDVISYYKNMI